MFLEDSRVHLADMFWFNANSAPDIARNLVNGEEREQNCSSIRMLLSRMELWSLYRGSELLEWEKGDVPPSPGDVVRV